MNECNLTKDKFKGKRKAFLLAELALRGAAWHIWKERNEEFFSKREDTRLWYSEIYEDMHILLKTCTWKTRQTPSSVSVLCNWGINVSEV